VRNIKDVDAMIEGPDVQSSSRGIATSKDKSQMLEAMVGWKNQAKTLRKHTARPTDERAHIA